MANKIQGFTLFNALKAAGDKGLTKTQIAEILKVAEGSVPVYIYDLKLFYKAEVENIREGRKVTGYVLKNADKIVVPENGRRGKNAKPSVAKPTAVDKPIVESVGNKSEVILDKDLDIAEFSQREMNDIRSSLGI